MKRAAGRKQWEPLAAPSPLGGESLFIVIDSSWRFLALPWPVEEARLDGKVETVPAAEINRKLNWPTEHPRTDRPNQF